MKQFLLSVQFYQNMEQGVFYNTAVRELCFLWERFPLALSVPVPWARCKPKGAASGTVMRSY